MTPDPSARAAVEAWMELYCPHDERMPGQHRHTCPDCLLAFAAAQVREQWAVSEYVDVRYDATAGVWVSKLGDGPHALFTQGRTREHAITALWSAAWLYILTQHEHRARREGPGGEK